MRCRANMWDIYEVHYKAMNRMRVTKSKRNNRRAHHGVTVTAHTTDGDGVVRMRHRASRLTGVYRGRKVLDSVQKAEHKQKEGSAEEKNTVEQVAAPK